MGSRPSSGRGSFAPIGLAWRLASDTAGPRLENSVQEFCPLTSGKHSAGTPSGPRPGPMPRPRGPRTTVSHSRQENVVYFLEKRFWPGAGPAGGPQTALSGPRSLRRLPFQTLERRFMGRAAANGVQDPGKRFNGIGLAKETDPPGIQRLPLSAPSTVTRG